MADLPGPERRQVKSAEVPRTTYQSIRNRAFVNGWLRERFIPLPEITGAKRIRFFVAQPYNERWNDAVRILRARRDLVVLWAAPETLFGVMFEKPARQRGDELGLAETFRRHWAVWSGEKGEGVLAYFDYEGCWSRLTRNVQPLAYPRAFRNPPLPALPLSRRDWMDVRGLLSRPFVLPSNGSSFANFISSRLSHGEQRLLTNGWITRRVLPDFSEIPSVQEYRPERVVFITGLTQPGRHPRDLFSNLNQRARVAPFLFAYDENRVLLLTISPAPLHITQERASVSDVLREYLVKIEVTREPIDSLFPVVDHRYDRLLESSHRERLDDSLPTSGPHGLGADESGSQDFVRQNTPGAFPDFPGIR
jgi:hypothetical protein